MEIKTLLIIIAVTAIVICLSHFTELINNFFIIRKSNKVHERNIDIKTREAKYWKERVVKSNSESNNEINSLSDELFKSRGEATRLRKINNDAVKSIASLRKQLDIQTEDRASIIADISVAIKRDAEIKKELLAKFSHWYGKGQRFKEFKKIINGGLND